jgi:hypothetical protein
MAPKEELNNQQIAYLKAHFNLEETELVRFAISYLYGMVKSAVNQYPQPAYYPYVSPNFPYTPIHQFDPTPQYASPPPYAPQQQPPPNQSTNIFTDLLKVLIPKCWCGEPLTTPHPHGAI